MVILPAVTALLVLGVSLLLGRDYAADSKFVPQRVDRNASRFAGLAAQFGINLSETNNADSPDFYVQLLRSREVLRALVQTEYRFARGRNKRDTLTGNLLDLLEIKESRNRTRLQRGVEAADKHIGTRVDVKTGLVAVTSVAPWPGLAEQMNRRLLELVNQFNLERRQSQAAEERRFAEGRMRDAQRQLEAAEGQLASFLTANRQYRGSPQLEFQYGKLQRRVDLQQQVYVSLAQSFEQARVDEVRNTPLITVLDGPEGSAEPTGRGPVANTFLGVVLGVLLAGITAVIVELLPRRRRSGPADDAVSTAPPVAVQSAGHERIERTEKARTSPSSLPS
jgi:hypothetical protein